jgi:3-methylcrotonyl-CoA carboxylase alpha subunit
VRTAPRLSEFHIVGLATNIAFLKRLVEGSAFASADLDTGLIERNNAVLFPAAGPAPTGALALAAVALVDAERALSVSNNPADPWTNTHGWRMNGTYRRQLSLGDEYAATLDAKAYRIGLAYHPHGWVLELDGVAHPLALVARQDGEYAIRLDGTALHGTVRRDGELLHVFQQVKKGEALVIMEAMKMEHTISAPSDGLVEEVLYQVGDQVADGAPLLAFKAA